MHLPHSGHFEQFESCVSFLAPILLAFSRGIMYLQIGCFTKLVKRCMQFHVLSFTEPIQIPRNSIKVVLENFYFVYNVKIFRAQFRSF